MKAVLAAALLLAAAPPVLAQDYTNVSLRPLHDSDNLPRIPGAPFQPGDPDVRTDNHTATHQPLEGTVSPVPAVSVPADNRPRSH